MSDKAKVTFLVDKDLLTEYKQCLREDGRILTSELNKHIRDYIRESKEKRNE